MVLNHNTIDAESVSSSVPSLPPAAPLLSDVSIQPWDELRDAGIAPRVASEGCAQARDQAAFDHGFELLRFDLKGRGVLPQQVRLVDALSQGRRFAAIMLPRQSSKTASIETYLLGLCATVPGLRVMFLTASSGKRGQTHFWEEIAPVLEARYPDKTTRPFVLRKGNGSSSIAWPNGSRFSVALTKEDFIGASVDIAWIDEAGKLDGEKKAEMLSAILPTQDTRKGVVLAQPLLILSGTAGKLRKGNALWDYLEKGRNGDADTAILEYSVDQDLVVDDIETWEDTTPLLLSAHPGVGTLTDLDMIKSSFDTMTREEFASEYLGLFGKTGSTSGLINVSKWEAGLLNDDPERPEWFALGAAVSYRGTHSSLVAAWRVDGVAHIAVLDHREGVHGYAAEIEKLARANRYAPIVYDRKGPIVNEIDTVLREYPRARIEALPDRHVTAYGPLFVKEVHTGNLKHYGQGALTTAVLSVLERKVGAGWAFGRPDLGADTSAAEAAAYALITYDNTPQRKAAKFGFA